MKINKEHIIVLLFSIILIFIVIVIAYFALFQAETTKKPNSTPPTIPAPTDQITIPREAKTNPPIQYNSDAVLKMLERLANRIPLSQSDSLAKEKILSLLPAGQVSGILYSSRAIIVDYTKAADQFQVEILTINIGQAKTEAVNWFASQGMSKEGVCSLPVVFYLNPATADQLRSLDIQFNPLAEGC